MKTPPKTRMVSYRITPEVGFDPNQTEQERIQECAKAEFRPGFFHKWTEIECNGVVGNNVFIKAVALVENPDNGKIDFVDPENIIFEKENEA